MSYHIEDLYVGKSTVEIYYDTFSKFNKMFSFENSVLKEKINLTGKNETLEFNESL